MQSAQPYGTFPIPGYYPPQQMAPPLPHMMNQMVYSPETRPMNGMGGNGSGRNGHGHDSISAHHGRTSSRNSTGHNTMNGSGKRGAPPARSAWSYGPGVSMGGFGYGNPSGMSGGGSDVVGPRLSSAMRRTSQTSSVGSGSTGNRTPGDEASSTAVSRFPSATFVPWLNSNRIVAYSHLLLPLRHHGGHIHPLHPPNIRYLHGRTGQ